jgi:uncharacterized membrane protein YvbJ
MSNCPKCNTQVSEQALECPKCGILFSKWQERESNISSGNMARYSLGTATSSGFNWTILIIVCLVVLGILFFMRFRAELS